MSRADDFIASMADVPEEEWDPKFLQALTTMYFRATRSTPSITPFSKLDFQAVREEQSTQLSPPASSVPTSSNTQRLEESLSVMGTITKTEWIVSYVELDGHGGNEWVNHPPFDNLEMANEYYEMLAEVYRSVLLEERLYKTLRGSDEL